MLSHAALMMNPNLDERQLKECLELSFESKHRQLDSIKELRKKLEAQNEEFEKMDQQRLQEAKDWNEKHPDCWFPLPRIKSKSERQMEIESLVWQMQLLVLLY